MTLPNHVIVKAVVNSNKMIQSFMADKLAQIAAGF